MTPRNEVRKAVRTLERLNEDKDFEYMCGVQLSEDPSQVLPNSPAGFQDGECSRINIEPRDSKDEVSAVFTLRHEGIHARIIFQQGPKAVENEWGVAHEIEAHKETIKFGRDWLKRERSAARRRRIKEEIDEETRAISVLQRGAAR